MTEPEFKFELRRLSDRSDESLMAELQRVAKLVSGPLTQQAYSAFGKVDRTTIHRRFGSWEAALRAAGLHHKIHARHFRLTDEEVLEELRRVAAKVSKSFLTIRDVEKHSNISSDRLRRSWGSVRKAFEAAGLSATPVGKRYDDEERFENLLAVWTHYGRPPQYREMYQPPSRVGGKAYTLRYGSWLAALEAFVDRVNADSPSQERPRIVRIDHPQTIDRDPRDVPLGLRFKVLQRDRFRCVLCGNNPPIDPGCVLHVDHVEPWSLGGATVLENLRTLCAICNIGRSNRYGRDDMPATGS